MRDTYRQRTNTEGAPRRQRATQGSSTRSRFDYSSRSGQSGQSRRASRSGRSGLSNRPPAQRVATQTGRRSANTSMPRMQGARSGGFIIAALRPYLPIVGIVAAVVVLVVLISSLMRSCSTQKSASNSEPVGNLTQTLAETSGTAIIQSAAEARVGSLAVRANTKLNHDALIAEIASQYSSVTSRKGLDAADSRNGLSLSSRNEQAANYVLGLNTTHGETVSYSGTTTKGKVPKLYQWDERWGYLSYCDMPLGFSGCGVTVMAMARMGLTGQTDMDPADMAALSVAEGEADGGTLSSFFTNYSVELQTGVAGERLESTDSSFLTQYASDTSYVLVNVRANTLAGGGHWVLVVGVNGDGTLEIRDPNSPTNTAKAWDADELSSYATAYIILRAA